MDKKIFLALSARASKFCSDVAYSVKNFKEMSLTALNNFLPVAYTI
jgi:hypothetical protein